MAGGYLIIDLTGDAPQLVSADQLLPALLLAKLDDIDTKLGTIIMTQAQYEADIEAIRAFFTNLPGQLDAIRSAMSNAAATGVTDLSALDDLAGQANAAGTAVGSVVASPATPAVPPDLSAPLPSAPTSDQPAAPDAGTADTAGGTDTMGTSDVPPDAPPPPDAAPSS